MKAQSWPTAVIPKPEALRPPCREPDNAKPKIRVLGSGISAEPPQGRRVRELSK